MSPVGKGCTIKLGYGLDMCHTHTPLTIPGLCSEPASRHTSALLPMWSSFPALIFSEISKEEGEREGQEKNRERERRNKMHFMFFKTLTKSRKCPLLICFEDPYSVLILYSTFLVFCCCHIFCVYVCLTVHV